MKNKNFYQEEKTKKLTNITFRIEEEDRKQMEILAKEKGLTLSAYIRSKCLNKI